MPTKTLTVGGGSVDVHVLESSANYLAWLQDIKSVATRYKVWKLINGEDDIIQKPHRPAAGAKVEDREAYKYDREDYEKQQEKISTALDLLNESVHISIRSGIFDFTDPDGAFTYLKAQYEPNKSCSLIAALNKMEAITFKSGTLVVNFMNMLRTAKNDIEAAGGKYDNAYMVAKLSRSLPKDYDDFISTKIEIVDLMPEFDKIVPDLLTFETRFVTRTKPTSKKDEKDDKKDNKSKTEGGKLKKMRPRCTKPPGCGNFGHTNDECRILYPELAPPPDDKDTKAQPEKKNDDTKPKAAFKPKVVKELGA